MAKEYIEREAVINHLQSTSMPEDTYGKGIRRGIGYAIDFINKVAAADVVEVVHENSCFTNLDRIRQFTTQEFRNFVFSLELYKCNGCPVKKTCGQEDNYDGCAATFDRWLNSPYEKDGENVPAWEKVIFDG